MLTADKAQNVFDVGFEQAWKRVHEETAAIRLPAKCAGCAARDNCKACAAMVYTESGNFHTVPQYRCEMTKAYPDACKRLANEILSRREENKNA